jgi:nucleoside phosphorylase
MFESLASCFAFRCSASLNMTGIAVTFALPAESSEFLRRLRNKSRTDRNGIRAVRGTIGDREIEVMHTGVGEKVCRQRLAKFLQDQQFDCLISAGFAGALNDELRVGDLLLARNFSTVRLIRAVASFSNLPIRVADLLTVPALINSSEERNETARTSGAAAIDMETEFIARICAERGVPLLSLRVITDAPREAFPVPVDVLFDIEHQRIPLLALTRFVLTHASRIPRLIQFTRRIAQARKILANALVTTINKL